MLTECLCVASSTSQYLKDEVRPPVFTSLSVFSSSSLSAGSLDPLPEMIIIAMCLHATEISHAHTYLCWHHRRWRLCPQPVSWSQPVTHMFVCLRRICQVSHANRFFRVRQILCRFSVTQVCFVRRCLGSTLTQFFIIIYFYSDILQAEKSWNCSSAHQSSQKFRICK